MPHKTLTYYGLKRPRPKPTDPSYENPLEKEPWKIKEVLAWVQNTGSLKEAIERTPGVSSLDWGLLADTNNAKLKAQIKRAEDAGRKGSTERTHVELTGKFFEPITSEERSGEEPKNGDDDDKAEKTTTPKLTLRKGQVSFQPKGSDEPVAAYTVDSTPHLLVVAGRRPSKWDIYHRPSGEWMSNTDRGTLKEVRDNVDKLGKVGDWKSLETIQETVPSGLKRKVLARGIIQSKTAEDAIDDALKNTKKSADVDGDGKVEKDEKELVSAKAAVNVANSRRLNLDLTPDQPKLRDAHGHYLSKSEDLAEAVAEYKDNRDKTRLSSSEKKAVSAAAGVSSSDKRPSTSRKGGRGRTRY